jgi:hypothetical protein
MNKTFTVYRKSDGIFVAQLTADDSHAQMNTPEGCALVEGAYDHLSQRMNLASGNVEDWRPSSPSIDHEWDEASKRWRLNSDAAAREQTKIATRTRIAHLETNVQPRTIRESALNQPDAQKRLQDIDAEIAGLRKQLDKG